MPKPEPERQARNEEGTPVVEIARDEARRVRLQVRDLLRAREQFHLFGPFGRGEAEMEVEDLEPALLAFPESDRGVLASAPFPSADREVDVALAQNRKAAERRVPVAALAQRHVVADGAVGK